MVNHIRTLLLNQTSVVVTGVSSIYVPPDYTSISVPAWLQPIQFSITPYGTPVEEQIVIIDNLLPLLHCEELSPYMTRFDTRLTYTGQPLAELQELLTTDAVPTVYTVTSIAQRMLGFPTIGVTSKSVFNWPLYASDEADFVAMWNQGEGTLRIGAMILGYAYQLERIREGNS